MKKNTIAYTPNSVSQHKLNAVNKIAKVAFNVDELLDGIFSPAKFHPSMMNLDGYLIGKTYYVIKIASGFWENEKYGE